MRTPREFRIEQVRQALAAGKRVAILSLRGDIIASNAGNYTAVEFIPPKINGHEIEYAWLDEAKKEWK